MILLLKCDGCLHIVNSRGIGRKFQLGQNGIHHVPFAFHQVRQKNFVLDQLRSFFCQIGFATGEQLFEALPRLPPVFFEKRDLRQVKARIPKLWIDLGGFLKRGFRLIVVALSHQDDPAQISRGGQIRLARIDRVELL